MIVTPAAATEPVEQNASTSAPKKQRSCVLNALGEKRFAVLKLGAGDELASRPGWAEELPELFEEERARATIAHVFDRTAEGNRGKSEQ